MKINSSGAELEKRSQNSEYKSLKFTLERLKTQPSEQKAFVPFAKERDGFGKMLSSTHSPFMAKRSLPVCLAQQDQTHSCFTSLLPTFRGKSNKKKLDGCGRGFSESLKS